MTLRLNWPKVIITVLISFSLIALSTYAGYWYRAKQTSSDRRIAPTPAGERSLPEQLLVYTRCFRGERKRYPDTCGLYTAQVGDYRTEKKVYTFGFPQYDEEKEEYLQKVFKVELVGVVDKYAVYKKWDEVGGENVIKLGLVNLETGEEAIIHKFAETEIPDQVVYLDNLNKRIYYATTSGPFVNEKGEVKQYDLSTGSSKVVAGTNILDKPYVVLFSSKDQLYLSPIPGLGLTFVWDETLNLEDGTLTDVANPRENPTFNPGGSKVVYTETERLADRLIARLKLANIDGSEEQELHSKKSQEGDVYAPSFHSIAFDHSGNIVTAKLDTQHLNVGKTETFVWNLKPSLHYPLGPHEIVPGAEDFRFVNYEVKYWHGPRIAYSTSGRGPGVLYEQDGAWFVRESIFSFLVRGEPINLYDRRKALVADAEDVFLIP